MQSFIFYKIILVYYTHPMSHSFTLLEYLDIETNHLTGQIPVELYNPKFFTLRMTENLLKGSINTLIGTMMNLTDFTIGSSLVTGMIPKELFYVTTLRILDLHNASFSGPLLGSGFANLTELKRFEVQDNDFTGTIPIDAIAMMSNLERLRIQGNDQLTGTISEAVCGLRGTTPNTLQILNANCDIQCSCCGDRKC
jgi:LRR receptor-like serine/threonine-protein kinase FLS2